jgi:rhodanese-related sulfurtransferase
MARAASFHAPVFRSTKEFDMIRFVVLAVAAATAILSAPIAAQGADEQPGADHPLLVSTGWLAERVDQPGLVVLHVAREEEAYREGHVPGARFLRLGSIVMERDGIPNELPDVEELREAFERAGVSDDSHVVVYGEMGGLAAGRTFFTLDYLGHQRVSLLDGGLEQWRSEGRAVETAARPAERGHFTPRPDPRRVVTADWVHERLDDPGYVLIDARPPAQYTGEDAAGLRPVTFRVRTTSSGGARWSPTTTSGCGPRPSSARCSSAPARPANARWSRTVAPAFRRATRTSWRGCSATTW